jgi:hypothetical protein
MATRAITTATATAAMWALVTAMRLAGNKEGKGKGGKGNGNSNEGGGQGRGQGRQGNGNGVCVCVSGLWLKGEEL